MHVLAARCDLETGRSLNIAPPGWRKTLGRLRDGFNHEHGRSRPDGPARVRADEPGDRAYVDAANLQAGLAVEPDPRELIRDYLGAARRAGPRTQRADVVAALKDAGLDVPRQGDSYVTARDPETGKRWPLKGALYECTSMTSSQNDLAAWLRRKWETDRREIEETGVTELRRLGESLNSAARSAQRSIDADMAAWTERTRALLMRTWLLPAAAGLSLFLVICGGSWGTMRWLSMRIESQLQTLAILDVDIEQARQTLTELETATWRIELREIDGERFVVLPAGSLVRPPWTVEQRFRGSGTRIPAKWNARRSVATFVGQFPPVRVETGR